MLTYSLGVNIIVVAIETVWLPFTKKCVVAMVTVWPSCDSVWLLQ